ncbi:MAG: M1 family metallopeptidase [Chloroflexota bacterium]|nr:M1 family metallopeptidase [Chloroflexota bacterium]
MARRGILVPLAALLFFLPAAQGASRLPLPSPPALSPTPTVAPAVKPVLSDEESRYAAVLPAYRQDVMAATGNTLPRYAIKATVRPDSTVAMATPVSDSSPVENATAAEEAPLTATINGTVELRFVNNTEAPLPDLYLRLYPNLDRYPGGGLVVRDLRVDGFPVAPDSLPLPNPPGNPGIASPAPRQEAASVDPTLRRVRLVRPLAPGGVTTLTMAFVTTVPPASLGGFGIFGITPETETFALANWFPMLAGYDPVRGWELEPPSPLGDPLFANSAQFDVELIAPSELALVTTGVRVDQRIEGYSTLHHFVAGPARDFTVVADDEFTSISQRVNGTTVTAHFRPDEQGGPLINTWAAAALTVYTDLYGPYPYAELDVVSVPGVIGYEFSQLIYIGADFFADPIGAGSRPEAAEFLVAHEVGHQWWYDLVGNNPHRHAFLDESLAEYGAILYFERRYGEPNSQAQIAVGLSLRYVTMLLTSGDQAVDQPTAAFADGLGYFTTVYRKGALGFSALRDHIGDEAFLAGLRDYAATMRFGVARPEDLRAAFERAAGQDLTAFWTSAFEATEGRVSVVVVASPTAGTPPPD